MRGALAFPFQGSLNLHDLALDLPDFGIFTGERGGKLGAFALKFRQTHAEVLQEFVIKDARQGSVVARPQQAEQRFLFISHSLRSAKFLLELSETLVHHIFGTAFVRLEKKQVVAGGILVQVILRSLQLRFQIQHLLRKPLGSLLRRVPPRFEVLLDVIGSNRVHHVRSQVGILRIETDLYRAAAPEGLDVQASLKVGQHGFPQGRVARGHMEVSGRRLDLPQKTGPGALLRMKLGDPIEAELGYDALRKVIAAEHFVLSL